MVNPPNRVERASDVVTLPSRFFRTGPGPVVSSVDMDTLILIPAEFYLAPVDNGVKTSLAVFSRELVKKGGRFLPCQGAVKLERVDLEACPPKMDVRERLGCLDVVQQLDGGRHVRQCNWIRFLTITASQSEDVNLVAVFVDDQPVFHVLKDISPRTLLVARVLEDSTGARGIQDSPLDLSTSLWSPSECTQSVATPSRRLSHRAVLPCGVCGKTFDRPSLLKRHMRTHTGEKPHVCEVCSKGFSTSSSLNTHRRIHSGEKPHECQTCGKRFTASSNLYYHRMTHTKEKPHKCVECSKSFPTPGDLKAHTYIHSGSWPYRCSVCNRGFSKQTNLRNHAFLHTGDRPHPCKICGKKFALMCNLRAHTKTHHQDREPDSETPLRSSQAPCDGHTLEGGPCFVNGHVNFRPHPFADDVTTQDATSWKTGSKQRATKNSAPEEYDTEPERNTATHFNDAPVKGCQMGDFSRVFNYSDILFGLSMPMTNNLSSFEDFWLKTNFVNNTPMNQFSFLQTPVNANPVHSPFMTTMSLVELQAMLFMQADMAGVLKHNTRLNMSYN